MDDVLVQRWKAGDTQARTGVRNAVRSISERVLTHPALRGALGPQMQQRLADEVERRRLNTAVADEVLKRGADSSAQLTALALLVVGRHVVQGMQEGRPPTEEAHLPPQVAVTYALSPDAVSDRIRKGAESHLERCGLCREDLRIVRSVMRSQGAVDHDASPQRLADQVASGGVTDGDDLAQMMDASVAQVHRRSASSSAGPSRSVSRRSSLPGPDPRPRTRGAVWAALPVLAILIGLGWHWWSRGGGAFLGTIEGLSALADRSPPRIPKLSALPDDAQFALGDLSAGDCRTAAGRFHSSRGTHPDMLQLYMLEGASWVCVGDGRRAMGVFDDMDKAAARGQTALPRQAAWYRAQAQLLTNDPQGALESLHTAQVVDSRHRDLATAQANRLQLLMP